MTHLDFTHRTRGLLGDEGLAALGRPLVAIAGLGGVGGAAGVIAALDGTRSQDEALATVGAGGAVIEEVEALADQGVIVSRDQQRKPATADEYQECTRCVNNDYVLPGLEFDDHGACAFCQCFENVPDAGPLHGGVVTDEQAKVELAERGYWGQPEPLKPLLAALDLTPEQASELPGLLPCIVQGCKW